MLYCGKRTKSKSELPFRIMNQHCSSCVNNSDGGVFVLGFWRMKYYVGNVLVSGWKQVLPAFSTYFAGLCSGLWHRASLLARVSVLYLLLFCIVSPDFFLIYFKYIANNMLLIGQLKFIDWFYVAVAIFTVVQYF